MTAQADVIHEGFLCIDATPGLFTLPGNSEYVLLMDTSTKVPLPDYPANLASATDLAPGPRALSPGYPCTTVEAWLLVGGNDATVACQILVDKAGTTSAAWVTDPDGPGTAGVVTLTAGALDTIVWRPPSRHFRMRLLAGATAPTSIKGEILFTTMRGA